MKWQKYYGGYLVNQVQLGFLLFFFNFILLLVQPYHGGTLLKACANQPVSIPIDAGGSDF